MNRSYGILSVLAVAASLLATQPAFAQTTTDPAKLQQAKSLFIAGARAYTDRKYEVAIQAFEQANAIVPGAPVVFSIGQCYRKLYISTSRPEHVREAIKRYRDYLKMAPTGDRASEAEQAVQELSVIESKFAPGEGAASAPIAPKAKTLLSVSSSAEGATFTVDALPAASAGESIEVTPAKHHVRVSAAGYVDEERDLLAAESQITTLDIPLRERAAKLTISGTNGARVLVDGRDFGETPLSRADLPPGPHQIALVKTGRRYYSEEIEFTRGAEKKVRVDLEVSGQRKGSYVAFAIGGAAVLTGGVLSLLALSQESSATDIRDASDNGFLLNDPTRSKDGTAGDSRILEYNKYRDRRDSYNTASYVAYAIGGVAIATGFVLFTFDTPSPTGARRKEEKAPVPTTDKTAPDSKMMERGISFKPSVSPLFLGGAFEGRF